MPPSSSISGSNPAPALTPGTNPAQCGTADCINYIGCFTDLAGGVRAVPTAAYRTVRIKKCNGPWNVCFYYPTLVATGWTPLTCAAEAKKNGGTIIAIQVGTWHVWGVWPQGGDSLGLRGGPKRGMQGWGQHRIGGWAGTVVTAERIPLPPPKPPHPPRMQNGDKCFYGTDLGTAIAQGPSTACDGSNANSVYTII